jgi:glycerate kinase
MTEQTQKKRFSTVQVMEATAAAVLAAAVIGTAGGMGWLLIRLPNHLQQLEKTVAQILENQKGFEVRFTKLEETVKEQDRRLIRLEVD